MALLESGEATASAQAADTDLHAAQTMPHRDLQRSEALELAEAVFDPEIESAAGIYAGLEPERYLSNYAAVAPVASLPEGSTQSENSLASEHPNTPVLLESTLPLRTENSDGEEEAVQLELEHTAGELKPSNPLAEVGIPENLGEGISLTGPEIGVSVADAPAAVTPTDADGDFAFYPNVAEDTDLIVAPTAQGVETMTDIRSAEAPTETTYQLELPIGADLESTRDGGARVVDGSRTALLITPPTAIDAAGEPVAAEMTVSGDSITVSVDSSPSTGYPILVDPTFIQEAWAWSSNHESTESWIGSTSNATVMQPVPYALFAPQYPGLDISSGIGGWTSNGAEANWSHSVPRYQEDLSHFASAPTSYVNSMFTQGVFFVRYGNTENYPALILGLVDDQIGWQTDEVWYGGRGELYTWEDWFNLKNENANHEPDTHVKGVDMELFTPIAEYPAKRRDVYTAAASIAVGDNDAPAITNLEPPANWMNTTPEPVPYEMEDKGLGVFDATMSYGGTTLVGSGVTPSCYGTTTSPCPRIITSGSAGPGKVHLGNLAYNPAVLPTGRDAVTVMVADPLGSAGDPSHQTTKTVVLKVDHTGPEVSLSGPLTEQGALGTHRPAYPLRITAKDGVEGAPQSGVKKVEVLIDGKKVAMPEESEWEPNCQTQNCPFSGGEWSMSAAEYSAGTHEVKVVATDAVGNTTTKVLQVELHPSPPTLSLSGTLTEEASLGTEKPSYILKTSASALMESPSPATPPIYSSSFGSTGTGKGPFSHPGDVAIGQEGNLFVVDTQNAWVEKFNENGGYLAQFGGKGTGNGQFLRPTAIAVAANGNLWVTDAERRLVQEFTPAGVYVAQFGATGTGPGQFDGKEAEGPEGIAIDFHGNIWVSDTYGGRLEKFSENGTFIRSVSSFGTGPGQLRQPAGIDIGPGGNVFVADWGNDNVVEFGEGGAFIRQFGSTGKEAGQLERPTGIAIDSAGDVWVGDEKDERVDEFNQGGEYVRSFGTAGSGAGQFNLGYPDGLAADARGDIWVADSKDNRIEKWVSGNYGVGPAPTFTTAFATKGATTPLPTGVAIDAKGDIWTTDISTYTLQKYGPKGEYLASYGAPGQAAGQFFVPLGLTIASGHIWVADEFNNRVEEFNESGAYLGQFGSAGAGAGQFTYPAPPAVDPNHHVWVPDSNNNRVEEFTEAGAYIKSIGTTGTGKLSAPQDVAVGPGNTIFVADYSDNRVVEFNEAGTVVHVFGGAAAETGQLIQPIAVYVEAKTEDLWVVERGSNRVKGYTIGGEYLGQFGTTGSGTGQLSAPAYITGDEAGHLFVADMNNGRISEWTEPVVHSQLSTEITIDGRRKEAYETSCAAKACPSSHEWTLSSPTLTPGAHEVKVTATDGLGDTTTRTLTIKTGDTTKPGLEVGGELVSAPEGWVQQKEGTYGFHATGTDSGFGVRLLNFKIDGGSVVSKKQTCPSGGCSATISASVDVRELSAGSHQAEVVATDTAGNTATKSWTINVDPEGAISTEEAVATFEAFEGTAPIPIVGEPSAPESGWSEPGLGVERVGGELRGTGGAVPITFSTAAEGEMEFEIAQNPVGQKICSESEGEKEAAESGEELEEGTGGPGTEEDGECISRTVAELKIAEENAAIANGEKTPGREPITIVPVGTGQLGEGVSIVEGMAVVTPNTNDETDTVTRPLGDGGLTFANIRSSSAPEHYAFEIAPYSSELELKSVSPQVITAFYKEGGYAAFTLEAEPASDAEGREVPTHLSLTNPNRVTLTVEHRGVSGETGKPFVYPVVAGAGWRGGWFYGTVESYIPEEEAEEGAEGGESGGGIALVEYGPPTLAPSGAAGNSVEPLDLTTHERRFKFTYCWPKNIPGAPGPPGSFELPNVWSGGGGGEEDALISPRASECHNEAFHGIHWATSVHGHFEYKTHHWVHVLPESLGCTEWGEEKPLRKVCRVGTEGFVPGPAYVLADFRFHEGKGDWGWLDKPTCYVTGGAIYPRISGGNGEPYIRPMLWHPTALPYADEGCDWSSLETAAEDETPNGQ